MAKPGPTPKPRLQVVREGNPGKRPIREGLQAKPERPDEPNWSEWFQDLPALDWRPPRARKHETPEEAARRRELTALHKDLTANRRRRSAISRLARADASKEWRRVVPWLDGQGLLAGVDRGVLADYCVCWARILMCERDISMHGIWVQGERGAQKNPSTTAVNQYRTHARFYVGELGLTPVARDRLPSGGADDNEGSVFDI